MRNQKQKRSSRANRIKSQMVGLVIQWDDPEPNNFSEHVVNGLIWHRNPVSRLNADMIYRNFKLMCGEVRMLYSVEIKVIFKYDNGMNGEIERELKSFCLIKEIEKLSLDLIDEAMREGDKSKFSHVSFRVECLSQHAPQKTVEEKLIEKLSELTAA
jgi:hypothetical protein